MTNIIFLDFDGVLNTTRYRYEMAQKDIRPCDQYGFLFDPEAIENLKSIIDSTGAKVCVTSSWAWEIGPKNLSTFWKKRNMPGLLSGTTVGVQVYPECAIIDEDEFDPFKLMGQGIAGRGSEIESYLKAKGYRDVRYVIIDDVMDFKKEQLAFLVKTDPEVGITKQDAQKAIRILNGMED